jgi:hypothetical protein
LVAAAAAEEEEKKKKKRRRRRRRNADAFAKAKQGRANSKLAHSVGITWAHPWGGGTISAHITPEVAAS